jgi:hypothetical protein
MIQGLAYINRPRLLHAHGKGAVTTVDHATIQTDKPCMWAVAYACHTSCPPSRKQRIIVPIIGDRSFPRAAAT